MAIRKLTLAGIAVALGGTLAIACGPEFPWLLLQDRQATLRAVPHNGFDFEAERLVPRPAGTLTAAEAMDAFEPAAFLQATEAAEAAALDPEDASLIQTVRSSPTGAAALEAGARLPPAPRLYAAAAVDFRAGAWDEAAERFQAVLDLSESERQDRAVWAAFMLGRTEAKRGNPEKARTAFRFARRLALAGAPDPLGLGLSSYGEEAKLSYAAAAAITGEDGPVPAEAREAYRSHMATAAGLYAEQAAWGSLRGRLSLRIVAAEILKERSRIVAAVGDPMVQRLLVIYALARVRDAAADDKLWDDWRSRQLARPARRPPETPPLQVLTGLVEAIERRGLDPVPGADRLAALAYRTGRFDLAGRLVQRSREPLAAWVRAKLALRRGDLSGAARAYADAARAFPPAEGSLDEESARLLDGERGVLSLARGEYAAALRSLLSNGAGFWGDAVHIADRVLTVDELKRFLSDTPSRSGPPLTDPTAIAGLRDLLARRLMRAGRFDEALPYFREDATRDQAAAYARALGNARGGLSAMARARAFYAAAILARRHGIAIMGTEGPPDYAGLAGNYGTGLGQKTVEGASATGDEKARHARSRPRPDLRFHYRYVAVEHAERAADLLPPRSQAFAAVLCRAAGWMKGTEGSGKRAGRLYARYLREGAAVPFAADFGSDCPEPDFDGVWRAYEPDFLRAIRRRLERP